MSADVTCIFCELVSGKKPSSRVYEDDISMGFMGIRPLHPGELMVIPIPIPTVRTEIVCIQIIHRRDRGLRARG